MMAEKRNFLICYDIADDKRLRRVHKLLSDVAFAVQYSVFEAELSTVEFEQLQAALRQQIKTDVDKVTFYRLFKKQPKLELSNKNDEGDLIFI